MHTRSLLCTALLLAPYAPVTWAQQLDADEIAIFDGQSRLDYPGRPALALSSPASVEFWVSAAWTEPLAYDPCVLSSIGQAGLNFAVHITADRKAIGVFTQGGFGTLPFDFSDGLMHHVTLVSLTRGLSEVQIDGDTAGFLPLGFGKSPSLSFHLGSLDGEQAPFVGALARVRLWNAVLDGQTRPEDLAAQSIFSAEALSLAVYPRGTEAVPADNPAQPASGGRRTLQRLPSPSGGPDP